jgi:dephospho-CoA kinase
MGKSTVTAHLKKLGFRVFDADTSVHEMYNVGGAAVQKVEALFPGSTLNGAVDRRKLGEFVIGKPEHMAALEGVVHPLVVEARSRFLREAQEAGDLLVIYDIPLLFETGMDKQCDYVICVSADENTQRARVLSRDNMTMDKFEKILAAQTPDAEKRT